MLYADNKMGPCCKHISQEKILGISDRIAVANDCQRKLLVASAGLHLVIPPHREIDGHRTVSLCVKKLQCIMFDAPLVQGKISTSEGYAQNSQHAYCLFHRILTRS